MERNERGKSRANGHECWHTKANSLFHTDVAPGSFFDLSQCGVPYTLKIPNLPPSFQPKEGYHPVTWCYNMVFDVHMAGAFANRMIWKVPITITPAPAPMLQGMGLLGQIAAPPPPVSFLEPPPPQLGVMALPAQAYFTQIPTNLYLQETDSESRRDFIDPQEDMNNFGAPEGYSVGGPVYPDLGIYAQQQPMFPMPALPAMDMGKTAKVYPTNAAGTQMQR